MTDLPRDDRGLFFSPDCIDPNCNGRLVREPRSSGFGSYWRCDGLTFESDRAPLVACWHTHDDCEPRAIQ